MFSTHRLRPAVWLAVVSCGACAPAGDPDRGADPRGDVVIPAVEVVQVRQGALPLRERLTGTVRAAGEVGIFPEINGPVEEVFVQNGDAVRRGDPLVRIRVTGSQSQEEQAQSAIVGARAEVRQAEATLKEAQTQFDRIAVLAERGLVSASEADTQRAQVETARATLARVRAGVAVAEATLAERKEASGQAIVRAPITGRVGQRNVEVGMRVDTQTPLFVIGRLERMRVEVPVTQESLSRVRVGQSVEIRPGGASAAPISAQVSRISPFLEETSLSAEVEIDVPNAAGVLVPGMFVTVDLFYGESERATLVPTSALHTDVVSGERGVFVTSATPASVQAGHPDDAGGGLSDEPVSIPFRPVTVVAEGGQTVAIEGIAPGSWVVAVGQHLLAAQEAGSAPQARIRLIAWDRILELQRLQRGDLLEDFMERQQQLSPPES